MPLGCAGKEGCNHVRNTAQGPDLQEARRRDGVLAGIVPATAPLLWPGSVGGP